MLNIFGLFSDSELVDLRPGDEGSSREMPRRSEKE